MLGWLVAAGIAGGWMARVTTQPAPAKVVLSDGPSTAALDQKIKALAERLQSAETIVFSLNSEVSAHSDILLDPTSKSFDRLDSNNGTFYVVLENVQPYVNGQKLTLRIGNPQSATFNGFELKLSWGKVDDPNYMKKRKTDKQTVDLRPGTWTRFEVPIAPATADDVQAGVTMSMTTNSLSLASR
jgi:hypothetical protein